MHRVPRPLLAPQPGAGGPQRVTVVPQLPASLRLDPLLPLGAAGLAGRPGSGSMDGGASCPAGDQSPLGGSAAGRAKGLLLRQPSAGPAASEELLITTAPLCSAGMHAHETLAWPFAQAAQAGLSQPTGLGWGADFGSGGPTPCSSPGPRLVPPIFERAPVQQAQHAGDSSGDGALPAPAPGSPLLMGASGSYLAVAAGLGPALLPSGLPASALLVQGGRLSSLQAGRPGAPPLTGLPSLAFNPLMLPSIGLGHAPPTTAISAGAVTTPVVGGIAGNRLAAGGDNLAVHCAGNGSGEREESGGKPAAAPAQARAAARPSAALNVDGASYTAAQVSVQERLLIHGWQPSPAPSPRDSQQDWLVPASAGARQASPASSGEPQHWP